MADEVATPEVEAPANTETADVPATVATDVPPEEAPATEEAQNILGEAATEVKVDVKEGESLLGDKEEAPAESQAPESYEFTTPEGVEIPEENLTRFSEIAKSADLSQEQAQKLLDLQAAEVQAADQAKVQLQEAWVDELKKDPDYGGAKLSETVERANRSLREYASPELVQLLKETGYANNPHVVKMFAKIDESNGEDSMVQGPSVSTVEKSTGEILYDNPTSKE
jgi:hypothetical protein